MGHEFTTDQYSGVLGETISLSGYNGDMIGAYFARPLGGGAVPSVVLVHHRPGWDEFFRETTRRFAEHGYAAICPNLYHRTGHGTPEDVAAMVRGAGGIPDDQAVGDLEACASFIRALPSTTGKVGIFGTCMGGRLGYLGATRTRAFDALVDCWGGRVVMPEKDLTPHQPVAPIDYTADLSCPILGLFGEEDTNPPPEQVAEHEGVLKQRGKTYEFHMYPNAGHAFFVWDRPSYRPEQTMDGWSKIWDFLGRYLGAAARGDQHGKV